MKPKRSSLMITGLITVSALFALPAPAQTSSADPARQPLNLSVVTPVVDCFAMTSADVSTVVGASTVIKTAEIVEDGKKDIVDKLKSH